MSDSEPDPDDSTGVDGGGFDEHLIVSSSSSSLDSMVITSILGFFGGALSGAVQTRELVTKYK